MRMRTVIVVAASALLPFMLGIWTSGTFANWIEGKVLPSKISIFGPAIIEQEDSTTLLPPGWRASVIAGAAMIVERG